MLTIEPKDGDNPAPAATHVLAGTISDGVAELSTSDAAALGSDFKSAAGSFILETPSSADTNDYASGVWFLDPTGGPGPSARQQRRHHRTEWSRRAALDRA